MKNYAIFIPRIKNEIADSKVVLRAFEYMRYKFIGYIQTDEALSAISRTEAVYVEVNTGAVHVGLDTIIKMTINSGKIDTQFEFQTCEMANLIAIFEYDRLPAILDENPDKVHEFSLSVSDVDIAKLSLHRATGDNQMGLFTGKEPQTVSVFLTKPQLIRFIIEAYRIITDVDHVDGPYSHNVGCAIHDIKYIHRTEKALPE